MTVKGHFGINIIALLDVSKLTVYVLIKTFFKQAKNKKLSFGLFFVVRIQYLRIRSNKRYRAFICYSKLIKSAYRLCVQ